MIGKKQQIEQEEVRAARPITIRALSILAAVVALAVSAAPASAVGDGTSNALPAAFSTPTSPPTPPGVPIPYPNFPDPVRVPTRPIK